MPLHLLGKKSWNVYNPESIARVRRDEAAAKAQEEETERRQREIEAQTRLRLLRGDVVSNDATSEHSNDGTSSSHAFDRAREPSRKRRKLAGEDDTDRDIRLARAERDDALAKSHDRALRDSRGHVDLVPQQSRKTEANNEEHMGMRFKDAAGYKSEGKPWYSSGPGALEPTGAIARDVWGNEDPRRHQREQQRTTMNDPLLAMKKGVQQLRENEKQRKEWMAQRERDLYEVERLARKDKKRHRRRGSDEDSLEDFSLDAPSQDAPKESRGEKRSHSHHRHRHRSRSPGRRHHHHHHRHRRRSVEA